MHVYVLCIHIHVYTCIYTTEAEDDVLEELFCWMACQPSCLSSISFMTHFYKYLFFQHFNVHYAPRHYSPAGMSGLSHNNALWRIYRVFIKSTLIMFTQCLIKINFNQCWINTFLNLGGAQSKFIQLLENQKPFIWIPSIKEVRCASCSSDCR